MTAELFTQSHRPAAYILGGSLNWLCNFTVGFIFPFLQVPAWGALGWDGHSPCFSPGAPQCLPVGPIPALPRPQMSAGAFCYLVFCGVCLLVALYVYLIIPETKNKTFMEISRTFATRRAALPACRGGMLKLRGYGALEGSLEGSGSGSGSGSELGSGLGSGSELGSGLGSGSGLA